MGAGPLAMISPILGLVGKLAGGAGGAGGGGAVAGATPWSAAITGQQPEAPPVPEQNPLLAGERDLFGPAAAIPPTPTSKAVGLFDESLANPGKAPKGAVPIPSRAPPVASLPGFGDPMEDRKGGIEVPERAPPVGSLPGFQDPMAELFATSPTAASMPKTAPINSTDKRNNSERLTDAGWTLDSKVGENVIKPSPLLAEPEAEDVPAPARKSAPSPDRGLFDPPKKTKAEPNQTLGSVDDEENGQENGMGLLPNSISGPIGSFQDALGDGATNPLFQMGMGLLAGGWDGSNPWKTALAGINAVPGHQIAAQSADLAQEANTRANKDQERQDRELALKMQEQGDMAGLAAMLKLMQAQDPQSRVARGAAKVITR